MKKKIIIANWKMYLDAKAAVVLAKKIRTVKSKNTIIIAPSFTDIAPVKKALGKSKIAISSQDMAPTDCGAYTGSVCGKDLKELGVKYVILGHSERRKYFGETYEMVNKKIKHAQKIGLIPILCVGERDIEKRAGKTLPVVASQLKTALRGVSAQKLIIAYEPVWAIGTGNPENPENANMVQGEIKKQVGNAPVLYGGSVDAKNFAGFLAQKNIDGLLVGGASTKWEEFKKIISN